MNTIANTQFHFPGQSGFYRGKVRDVYAVGEFLVMVASDRISAFDHILPRSIPDKGAVLNGIACHFLNATRDICPNWLLSMPDPNVAIGRLCAPIRVEMVIRGYLSGHAARTYAGGHRTLCGVPMPEGMREGDPFPDPIITPTTKAEAGHDLDISRSDILMNGVVSESIYNQMEGYTRALFRRGTEMAAARGLILVDTKYEFGITDGSVVLMDEIHTPDSSRFFLLEGYSDRQALGIRQSQLSKEFVREWLIANGFQGLEGQKVPSMPDEFVREVSSRYVALYERLIGQPFIRRPDTPTLLEDMQARVCAALRALH